MPAPVVICNKDLPHVALEINSDGSINTTATPPTGTSATQVQGTAASDAAVVGSPVQVGGRASNGTPSAVSTAGDAVPLWLSLNGSTVTQHKIIVNGAADGVSNNLTAPYGLNSGATAEAVLQTPVFPSVFNGTTWDRQRGTTNGTQIIGAAADDAAKAGAPVLTGGVYNTIANQSTLDTGDAGEFQVDMAGNLKTTTGAPAATDILAGYVQHTATTGAATLVTIPAGKTFIGTLTVSVAASKAAAATGNGLVSAVIATAGTNVTPAAGTIFAVSARIGANAATGVTGTQGNNNGSIPVIVNAPAGNSVTLTLASTLTNTSEGAVDASVFGRIQ